MVQSASGYIYCSQCARARVHLNQGIRDIGENLSIFVGYLRFRNVVNSSCINIIYISKMGCNLYFIICLYTDFEITFSQDIARFSCFLILLIFFEFRNVF